MIVSNVIIPFFILSLLYLFIIVTLCAILTRLGLSRGWAILLANLIFGLLSGLLAALLDPYSDNVVYVNLYAVLLGDEVYVFLTEWLGRANPDQAHSALPWPLRIPQLYILTGGLLFLVIGALAAAGSRGLDGGRTS